MTWCAGDSLPERFETARAFYVALHQRRRRPGRTFAGFEKALGKLPVPVLRAVATAVRCRLAQVFASWVKEDPRFELSAPVMMGVVCFRLKAADNSEADRKNARTVEAINATGQTYLMQTKLKGRIVMRLGLGNILTTEDHVRSAWEIIKGAV